MPRGLPDSFALNAVLKAGRRIGKAGSGARSRTNVTGVTYKLVNLTLFKPILNFELRSRSGMVDRHMGQIGSSVLRGARRQAGIKTGRLRASMKLTHTRSRGEVAVKIGAYTHYALMHHQGTRPHTITANKPGGNLVFRKGSRIIFTPIVMHPGTRPNRYLTDQLRKQILR
jgi:hypothetical protein